MNLILNIGKHFPANHGLFVPFHLTDCHTSAYQRNRKIRRAKSHTASRFLTCLKQLSDLRRKSYLVSPHWSLRFAARYCGTGQRTLNRAAGVDLEHGIAGSEREGHALYSLEVSTHANARPGLQPMGEAGFKGK